MTGTGTGSGSSSTGAVTSSAGGHQVSSFESSPYSSPMGGSTASSYYSQDRKHHNSHGFPFWPNDYKYPGVTDCQAFSAQSWYNCASPYASRVPSHMDAHHGQPVSYLTGASVAAAAAVDEQRRNAAAASEAASLHDTYGLRNPYGAPDPISASHYPAPGLYKTSFP